MPLKKQDLITYKLVKSVTPISRLVREPDLKSHMDLELIFNSRLGLDFLDVLLEDRIEYTVAEEFEEGKVYAEGVIVEYRESFYQKTAVVAGVVISDPSCEETYWTALPMFESSCLTDIWERLSNWLCWRIVYDAAPFIHDKYGPEGFTNYSGGSQKKAIDDSVLNRIVTQYGKRTSSHYRLMKKKIQEAYDTGDCDIFETVDFIDKKGLENEGVTGGSSSGLLYRYPWEE